MMENNNRTIRKRKRFIKRHFTTGSENMNVKVSISRLNKIK
jgi:hypothetical protein